MTSVMIAESLFNQEIYTRTWTPKEGFNKIRATVVFFHGFGEHIQRYDYIFTKFAEKGIQVHAFDQRGFGRTVRLSNHGLYGHNEGYDQLLLDGKIASDNIKKQNIPHFVMGHSMGGGIALRFALKYPNDVRGCIASAPLLKPGNSVKISDIELTIWKYVAKVIGNLPVSTPIYVEGLSKCPEARQRYQEDPYNHCYCSPRTAVDMFSNGRMLLEEDYKSFHVPLLIAHGTEDPITCYNSSKEFIEKVPSKDKEFKSYQGLLHEFHGNDRFPTFDIYDVNHGEDDTSSLHQELEKDKVIQDYIDWILSRS